MATHRFLYVIGPPGAGKSTSLNLALGAPAAEWYGWSPPYAEYAGGYQLGRATGERLGTDAILPARQGEVPKYLGELINRYRDNDWDMDVCAEGHGLADAAFLDDVAGQGWDVSAIYIGCAEMELRSRWRERGEPDISACERLAAEHELLRDELDCPVIDNTYRNAHKLLRDLAIIRSIRDGRLY